MTTIQAARIGCAPPRSAVPAHREIASRSFRARTARHRDRLRDSDALARLIRVDIEAAVHPRQAAEAV